MEAINVTADEVIGQILSNLLGDMERFFSADVVFLNKPMLPMVDDEFRQAVEKLCDEPQADSSVNRGSDCPKRLVIVLETPGGMVEVVERIVQAARMHYQIVDFIVPNFAYSAGTILVLSGDNIYMDYYSVLGPIDPQYRGEDGQYVPGIGYLAKYNELMKIINGADDVSHVKAELAYLTQKFDPAKLFHVEQAVSHSKALLEEWLPKYKFKDWAFREVSGMQVSDDDKKKRATEVAETLGNPERWHSHGRGISIRDLSSEEIKLKIENFGDDPSLNRIVRQYYTLAIDYSQKNGWGQFLHSRNGFSGGR